MAYNLTQLGESDTIYKLVVYGNTVTGGKLIFLFILALFFVMLMSLKRYEFDNAILVSSWVCFIISALFVYAQLLGLLWALLFLAIAAFTAFFMFVLK